MSARNAPTKARGVPATGRPGVSLCVPNWNHRRYLGRSVGSAIRAVRALQRAGFDGEVIVVDDASRDGSQRAAAAIALATADVAVDVVLSPVNRGLPATRMAGIERARFDHVCLLDADNEVIPEGLLTLWRGARDTGAALTYGNLLVTRGSTAIALHSNEVIDERILDNNYVDALCLVDRRLAREFGGYRLDLDTHEDWEFLLHLIAEGQEIVFVPTAVAYYYIEGVSMVQTVEVDHDRFRRMFNQRQAGLPRAFRAGRMYHPDLGWLRP